MTLKVITKAQVEACLSLPICIDLMRSTMIGLSDGAVQSAPRQVLPAGKGILGVMPGVMPEVFGVKILSVFPGISGTSSRHEGGVLIFDPADGRPVALVHAGAITAIRTAATSAFATDVLANPNASTLAILGYGHQARQHILALAGVRPIATVTIWGRDYDKAVAFAASIHDQTGLAVSAATSVQDATHNADIICTTTSAVEPILYASDVRPGTHINLVGSSHLKQVEADTGVVVQSRYFGDARDNIFAQGAEFVRARDEGAINESHFLGEIGEVAAGRTAGRTSETDITLYKSLGHIAQDLAAAWYVYQHVTP